MSFPKCQSSNIFNPDQVFRDAQGYLHSDTGPAVVKDSAEEYWAHGYLHRTDGPAVSLPDLEEWWVNGKRHRTDGPAIIDYLFEFEEWWVDGGHLSCQQIEEHKMRMFVEHGINLFHKKD